MRMESRRLTLVAASLMTVALAAAPAAAAHGKQLRTSTVLSVEPVQATVAASVTVTATVSPRSAGGPVNGGTVAFAATSALQAVALPQACFAAPVSSGVASCTFTPTSAGQYASTASYSGAPGFRASQGTVGFTVAPATTTTAVMFSGSRVTGQTLTANAVVSPTPDAGSVSFTVTNSGVTVATCSNVSVSGGSASCPFSAKSAGTYNVTATYSGDANFLGSPGSGSVTVTAPATPTVTVSDNAALVDQGTPVTFTADVAAAGSSVTSGTVAWQITSSTSLAATSCATTSFSGGVATCTVNTLLDPSGGWDGQGHDLNAGNITATATFNSTDPAYTNASGSDSTVKFTSVTALAGGTPVSGNLPVASGGQLSLSASASGYSGPVQWTWYCTTTSADCSWTQNLGTTTPTFFTNPVSFTVTGGLTFSAVVCPDVVGFDPYSGFACAQTPSVQVVPVL